MVATVTLRSEHGGTAGAPAGGSQTTVAVGGTIRFKRADNDTVNTVNPMVIPTSGENFSWRKNIHLSFDTAPAAQITDLRFIVTNTSVPSGFKMWAAQIAPSAYDVATSADEAANVSPTVDVTAGTTMSIISGTVVTNASTVPGFGDVTQNLILMQMSALSTATTTGTISGFTLTWRFDEV